MEILKKAFCAASRTFSQALPFIYAPCLWFCAQARGRVSNDFRLHSTPTESMGERTTHRPISCLDRHGGVSQCGSKQKNYAPEVLYAGVLIPRKGVHHLIKAFASLVDHFSQARPLIVGHEEKKTYTAELKNNVEQFALNESVKFVPTLSQKELAWRMRRACTLVLPSSSEGLGPLVAPECHH